MVDVPRTHIRPLTGVRALAAWWVVLFHLRQPAYVLLPSLAVLEPVLGAGYVGVDIFFLLSGFVIHHTYADALVARRAKAMLPFLRARIARIWPLHVAATLAAVALTLAFGAIGAREPAPPEYRSPAHWVANLLMLQDWSVPALVSFNVVSWSISAEWLAYALFPAILALALLVRGRWPLIVAALALAAAWGALTAFHSFALMSIPRVLLLFTAGVLLGRLYRQDDRPRVTAGASTLLCALALVAPCALLWAGMSPLLATPLFACALYALAHERGRAAALLSTRWAVAWGIWSFSLYLTHALVWRLTERTLHFAAALPGGALGRAAIMGAALVATAVTAWLAYRWIEAPAQRWIRGGRRPAPVATPAADAPGA